MALAMVMVMGMVMYMRKLVGIDHIHGDEQIAGLEAMPQNRQLRAIQ